MKTTITERKIRLVPRPEGVRQAYLDLELRDTDKGRELSICGTVKYEDGGESGGQNIDEIRQLYGQQPEVARICDLWDRWHLNGMRAGCEHQRAAWDTLEKVEVVSYGLTTEAYHERKRLMEAAATATARGELLDLTATGRALLALDDWYRLRHEPPDADSPLSGCYEVKEREEKTAGWVHPHEHPRGLLCKPCEVCGYKYGSAWLYEPLPQDVIDELFPAVPTT